MDKKKKELNNVRALKKYFKEWEVNRYGKDLIVIKKEDIAIYVEIHLAFILFTVKILSINEKIVHFTINKKEDWQERIKELIEIVEYIEKNQKEIIEKYNIVRNVVKKLNNYNQPTEVNIRIEYKENFVILITVEYYNKRYITVFGKDLKYKIARIAERIENVYLPMDMAKIEKIYTEIQEERKKLRLVIQEALQEKKEGEKDDI